MKYRYQKCEEKVRHENISSIDMDMYVIGFSI